VKALCLASTLDPFSKNGIVMKNFSFGGLASDQLSSGGWWMEWATYLWEFVIAK
jgi:hypothetical protein